MPLEMPIETLVDLTEGLNKSSPASETICMSFEDKLEHYTVSLTGELRFRTSTKTRPYIVNLIWNSVAKEKEKLIKHGINHTEEEYRLLSKSFMEIVKKKDAEMRQAKKISRSQFTRIANIEEERENLKNELEQTKSDNRDLKRSLDKMSDYKKEWVRLQKKLRTIQDYVTTQEDFHRTPIGADEYLDTDPYLRMFFEIE